MTNLKPMQKYNVQSRLFIEVVLAVLCFLFGATYSVNAQEKLSPNQPVARTIDPGKTDLFTIALKDGDFINVTIGYKGKINFFLINPDGTIARRAMGTSGEGKPSFPFAAEGAGSYQRSTREWHFMELCNQRK